MAARKRVILPDQETPGLETGDVTGETVTVACKLPHGLILRVFDMEDVAEPVMGGGSRMTPRAHQRGQTVVLNGFANPVMAAPKTLTYGGYGMTYNVDKEFYQLWLVQNDGADVIVNNLIFAFDSPDDAREQAHDMAEVKSGLEGIDPTKTMRVGMFGIKADETKSYGA